MKRMTHNQQLMRFETVQTLRYLCRNTLGIWSVDTQALLGKPLSKLTKRELVFAICRLYHKQKLTLADIISNDEVKEYFKG